MLDPKTLDLSTLPWIPTESIVSDVLNGKRQLTTRHRQELSKFFRVSPAVFFLINKEISNYNALSR